jgi:D-hydroxyproline dehydrogenase subunit beta
VPRDAVIGAGIVGLALARALAQRGRRVTVFETGQEPQGASARNFGTLWPIGQPAGARRALALESLRIWRDVLRDARAWCSPAGSLHVAYHDDEWQVLTEFAAQACAQGFACQLLSPADTVARQRLIHGEGLRGALWSPHELQVNPRQVLVHVAQWLEQRWDVRFERCTRVTSCAAGVVHAGSREWPVDRVWLATGDDLQTLYPETFQALGLRRCKLQMMRTAPVPWTLGPILAAGLTLGHYESFATCPSLPGLKARLRQDWPEHTAYGVHVLVAQHDAGHLVLGDSHEYDGAITPFDKPEVDQLVLGYLRTFLDADHFSIVERWHGVYVKHPHDPYCVFSPEDGVTAVTALGGHGMTLSFGLAEQVVRELVDQRPAFHQEQQA